MPGANRQPWGSGQVRFRRKVKLEAEAAAAERDVHLPGKQRIFMKTQGCALAMLWMIMLKYFWRCSSVFFESL